MTESVTHKKVWGLALPMIISNISIPLVGLVDTMVMGRMPDETWLGGVALATVIFQMIFWIFGFLRMGTAGLTAQALGREDGQGMRDVLLRAGIIATGVGLALILLGPALKALLFPLMGATGDVAAHADSYFTIRILGAPFSLMTFVLVGWFIGLHRTKRAMALQISAAVINVPLNLYFVFGLNMGAEGVALATVIAEATAMILALVMLPGLLSGISGRLRLAALRDTDGMVAMARINGAIFLRSFLLQLGFSSFAAIGARLGDLDLAANAILMNFLMVAAFGLDGFAFAAEALVGKSIGAKNRRNLDQAVRLVLINGLACGLLVSVVFLAAGQPILTLMTDVETLRTHTAQYLLWGALLPVSGVLAFMFDGIFIGATRGRDMTMAMGQSFIVYLAMLALLLGPMGNHGLWLAFHIFMVARGLTLWRYYPRLAKMADEKGTG